MTSIDYAIEMARKIPYVKGEQRHFAVVLDRKGKLISQGANSYIVTHPLMHKHSKKLGLCKDFIHSEVNALIKDKSRKGFKLIVVRIDSKGNPCNSEPCSVCKAIIKDNFKNILSLEYST